MRGEHQFLPTERHLVAVAYPLPQIKLQDAAVSVFLVCTTLAVSGELNPSTRLLRRCDVTSLCSSQFGDLSVCVPGFCGGLICDQCVLGVRS